MGLLGLIGSYKNIHNNKSVGRQMSQKPASTNSIQLKNQITSLTQTRQKIQKGNDVSGSMVHLNKTLSNIKPLLKKQQTYIKNFFSNEQSSSPQNKEAEIRRYVNRICEIALKDINDLLDVGQNYFTVDFKNNWTKIKNSFQKEFNTAREQVEQKNIVEFLFKVINVKDYLVTHFMRSLFYRKLVLWKDLNLGEDGYIHSQKKALLKMIDQDMLSKGYVPTKPVFDWMGLDVKGSWSMNKLDVPQFDLKYMLNTANQAVERVFEVLRNYANLTVQQRNHEDIDRNRDRVRSLRQQIQNSKLNYLALQKKYRQAILKDQKSDIVQLKQKVSQLQQSLEQKQNELKKIKFEFKDSSNEINTLKQKIKELEADLNRITNMEMKKLKEIQGLQLSLNDQFLKIHKNVSNFGSMFEFESEGKKSLAKEIMSQEKTIEKLVDMLNREKKKSRSQGEEIQRLNCIILQLGEKLRKR